MHRLSKTFAALGPREQRWLLVGVFTLLMALLLSVMVLPAVGSLRASPRAHQQANQQLQTLRLLQVRAKALQAQPQLQLDRTEAVNRLQASVSLLGGNTEFSMSDQRVNLVLRSIPSKALAEWLARARTDANAVLESARLLRDTQTDEPLWSGTLVMTLPPR
jgi:general secretion pathway protein M